MYFILAPIEPDQIAFVDSDSSRWEFIIMYIDCMFPKI